MIGTVDVLVQAARADSRKFSEWVGRLVRPDHRKRMIPARAGNGVAPEQALRHHPLALGYQRREPGTPTSPDRGTTPTAHNLP